MSNPRSIAAVTATMRGLLARVAVPLADEPDNDLSDTEVTTVPPDKAGLTEDHNQINLFLYHIAPNAAGRNRDGMGQTGKPPGLALDLYYVLTVYGRNSSDLLAQRLLGRAISILHSYAILSPTDIAAALPGTNLDKQPERVRINPHDVSNEELVRLWSAFQAKYRLSAVFRVSVVLIDHEVVVSEAPQPKSLVFKIGADSGLPSSMLGVGSALSSASSGSTTTDGSSGSSSASDSGATTDTGTGTSG